MNEHIVNYINTEKDLAKYNIVMLERGEDTPAKKRLIQIEKEFISIPFEKLSLQTVEEVASAIELYRQSRGLFYVKYDLGDTGDVTAKVSKKILFLDRTSKSLIANAINDDKIIRENYFVSEIIKAYSEKNSISLKQSEKIISNKTSIELADLEGSIIGKKRARLQVSLYSLGICIQNFLDNDINIEKNIDTNMHVINSKIDNFVFSLEKHIFKYYNDSLSIVSNKITSSAGKNNYIDRIYSLDNILYDYNDSHAHVYTCGNFVLNFSRPMIGNLYYGHKNAIFKTYQNDADRQTKNKVYGIIFPIERISREKMTSLYYEIYSCGINITELFNNNISNIQVTNINGENIYYKGILMKPLWQLLNYASESLEYHYIVSRLLDESLNNISKFNDKNFIKYLNEKKTPFIDVDSSSKILVPKTRSDEQYFDEILRLIYSKIDVIKNDYKNII